MKHTGDMSNYSLFDQKPPESTANFYSIDLGIEFREREGQILIGELQQEIQKGAIQRIHINLAMIEWIDPLPALMLLSVLGEYSNRNDPSRQPNITTDLGGHDVGRPEHRLCLKFLSSHGFTRLFSEVGEVKWRGIVESVSLATGEVEIEEKTYTDGHEIIDVMMRYSHTRAFNNSVLLPARLIPLCRATESNDALHDEVETLFVEMRTHARLAKFLDEPTARDILFQKVRTLLYELVLNVGEHAYPSSRPFGYAAVYARIHGRRPEFSAEGTIRRWNDLLRDDQVKLPGMSQFDPNPRIDWVEVFICDAGEGLTSKISQWKSSSNNKAVDRAIEKARQSKTPLESLSKRLFVSGFSRVSRDSPTRTPVTGLQHLGHVLSLDQDYARIYSDYGTWLGGSHPWRPTKRGDVEVASRLNSYSSKKFCGGTAYAIYIQPKTGVVLDAARWKPLENEARQEMLNALRGDQELNPIVSVYLCDRIEESNCRPPDQDETRDMAKFSDAEILNVVLRPPRLVGKHDIGSWLDWVARQVKPIGRYEKCVLYITELTPSQGTIFLEFIERNSARSKDGISIYLITDNWSVTCLVPVKHSGREFQFKTNLAEAARFHTSSPTHGALTSIELIKYLRSLDSEIFWANRYDDRENIVDLIRAGDTVWRETKQLTTVLTKYLDFGQALVNERRYKACLRALRRVLALLTDCRPIASDQLVDRLIRDSHSRNYDPSSQSDERNVVVVGSICVTARTTTRYLERLDLDVQDQVFLLINSDVELRPKPYVKNDSECSLDCGSDSASEKRIAALSWEPPDAPLTSDDCWERVPNTPFIAPKGGLSLSLVRFTGMEDGSSETHYPRSPAQMYRDFDRYAMLKLGHWNYQGRHDLITINLAQAFRYAHIEHGSMFLWLRDKFRDLFSANNDSNNPVAHLLVYPSHPVSDEIIALISTHPEFEGCLPKLGIFPVKYLGSHTVSPALASPMLENLVTRATRNLPRGSWGGVVFDDGAISGKHQTELGQLLQDLGSARVRTVAFVDRTGLPTRDGIVRSFSERHYRFWRLDLPTLGHQRDCALCGVLKIAKAYRSQVTHQLLKDRLDEWLQFWNIADVSTQWNTSGLPPVLFDTPEKLKFGITHNKNGNKFERSLDLNNSTSLSTALIELTRLTTRADKTLDRGKRISDKYPLAAMEIVASQLLLFWDELDYWERRDRFTELLRYLWNQTEESPATALCGLCLLLVDDRLIETLWADCSQLLKQRELLTRDAVLAVKMLYSRRGSDSRRQPVEPGISDVEKTNYVLTDLDQATVSALHEVISIAGDRRESWHATPLRDALKRISTGRTNANDALFAAQQMKRLIDVLDGPGFRMLVYVTPLEAIKEEIVGRLRSACLLLDVSGAGHALEVIRGENAAAEESGNTLHNLLGKLLIQIEHGCTLYSPIDNAKKSARNLWDAMVKEKAGINMNRWIAPSGEVVPPIWTCCDNAIASRSIRVYFSDLVKQEIIDRLLNAFHSPGPIKNPWNEEDSRLSDMWLRVSEDDDHLKCEFANGATGAHISSRYSLATSAVESVGGSVNTELKELGVMATVAKEASESGRSHTLFVTIRIPLMSYFIKRDA